MGHIRTGRSGRAVAMVVATLAALLATLVAPSLATPTAAAAPTFSVRGSIEQVATWGHPVGSTVELLDSSATVIATGAADAQGAFLFRNLTPGAGYTVREGGATSDPVAVSDPNVNPPQSFYGATQLSEGFGYLPTRDGTLLSVNVTYPKNGAPGPWPVLVDYSGYDPSQPGQTPSEAQIYPYLGYVVVGVNMRGTTCSGGAFWFFEDAQRTDGYDVIEGLAHQTWSNGNVGMVGISYSGYSQLYVAATQPPHLRAITPLSPYSDTFRGILYPGGILNNGFALNWALDRQQSSAPAAHSWVKSRISGGDTTCAANQVMRLQSEDLHAEITPDRFADPRYSYLDPSSFEPKINVPVFLATQWQDEQTGGYGVELATNLAKHTKVRVELTNGTHVDSLGPEDFLRAMEFVDFYVGKHLPTGEGNTFYRDAIQDGLKSIFGSDITLPAARFLGYTDFNQALAAYEAEPPVRIRWENGGVAGKEGAPYSTLTSLYAAWPIPGTSAQRLYLAPDGALASTAPTIADDQARGWSSYTYDPSGQRTSTYTGSTDSEWLAHPDVHWDNPREGKSLTFTTAPFTSKRAYAGNGSVDLWVRSTAADTDFEVNLTEVRPDGQEVNIQSGWLRASRRALDVANSTVLRPRQTFQEADAAPLPAGQFVPVRIELFPFAHIVRPGSKLRITIQAPGGNQPFWAFDDLPGTATNDVGHSVGRPSSVVLPLLTDGFVPFWSPSALPSCAVAGVTTQAQSLRNQPCRDDHPARIPSAVTGSVTGGRVSVAWVAPPGWSGAAAPTGFRVVADPSGTAVEAPAGATSVDFGSAAQFGSQVFRVAAEYGTTVAPLSDASLPITTAVPRSVVGQPADGSVSLSWLAPASGGTVIGYVVTPYAGSTAGTPQPFTSTATTQVVTGLTNGTAYTFTVAATYANGTGGASAPSAPVTPGVPGVPVLVSAKAGNGTATVGWWPPSGNGAPVTGSVITPYIGAVAQAPVIFTNGSNSQTVTGLTNGQTYTFKVAAVNSRGPSAQSSASNAVSVGAPGQPVLVSAVGGNGTATVGWWPTPNGAPITSSVITPYIGSVAQPPVSFSTGANSQVVTGLTNGQTYTFKVVTHNSFGDSPASAASTVASVGAPGQPVLVSAAPGSGSATVAWWPPAANGGAINQVVITPYIGSVAQPAVTFSSGANSQVVTGLADGTTYTFKVVVRNVDGSSPTSAASNPVTVGTPSAPVLQKATAVAGGAKVQWWPPTANGSPVTGVTITPYIGSVAQPAQTFVGGANSQTVTGLTTGVTYTFKIVATNARGSGLPSGATNAVTVL